MDGERTSDRRDIGQDGGVAMTDETSRGRAERWGRLPWLVLAANVVWMQAPRSELRPGVVWCGLAAGLFLVILADGIVALHRSAVDPDAVAPGRLLGLAVLLFFTSIPSTEALQWMLGRRIAPHVGAAPLVLSATFVLAAIGLELRAALVRNRREVDAFRARRRGLAASPSADPPRIETTRAAP